MNLQQLVQTNNRYYMGNDPDTQVVVKRIGSPVPITLRLEKGTDDLHKRVIQQLDRLYQKSPSCLSKKSDYNAYALSAPARNSNSSYIHYALEFLRTTGATIKRDNRGISELITACYDDELLFVSHRSNNLNSIATMTWRIDPNLNITERILYIVEFSENEDTRQTPTRSEVRLMTSGKEIPIETWYNYNDRNSNQFFLQVTNIDHSILPYLVTLMQRTMPKEHDLSFDMLYEVVREVYDFRN